MKGLIYVLAFLVGFAIGPDTISQASSQGPPVPDTIARSMVDPPVGTPVETAQSPVREAADPVNPQPVIPRGVVDPILAKIVIDAPTRGRVGELVRFDLTKSVAGSVKWLLNPVTPDFVAYDNGRRAVFSARAPGEYVFVIAVANDDTVDVVRHVIRIEGPPTKPESQSLAEWVPYWLYPMQLDKEEALSLAQSFEETSARITALSTPKGIIEATSEANRAALGDSLPTWVPLLKKIQAALANKAKAGTLATPEQHKEAWMEIAAGLRKYAQ